MLGPFDDKEQYNVAKACIYASRNGQVCNYIDLADDSDYVRNIASLNTEAVHAGCVLLSGASTTPAVTSAVVEYFSPGYFGVDARLRPVDTPALINRLDHLEVNLSVANSAMPGEGTVKSILSYCGKSIQGLYNGSLQEIYGWYRLTPTSFFGIPSSRLCSDVHVPDVSLVLGVNHCDNGLSGQSKHV